MANTKIYIVDSTDNSTNIAIQPRTIDGAGGVQANTDLTLYGNATPEWGERFNENFYRVLENFACAEKAGSPGVPQDENDIGITGFGINRPVQGQLWFNKTNDQMYVYNGLSWDVMGGAGTIDDIPGLRAELDNKVNRDGDTMSDTLNIVSNDASFKGLDVSSPSGAHIVIGSTNTNTGAGGLVLYNADNSTAAGGTHGSDGYTRLINRDKEVIRIERSDVSGVASGTSSMVLRILQEPGDNTDGEMQFYGGGSGNYNGDIRLPNASIDRVDHVATRGWVEGYVALAGGGGGGGGVTSVNGDTGPVVTLTAADFPDIYSKSEVDALLPPGGGVTSVNGDTGPAVTITAGDITDVYSQTQVDNRITAEIAGISGNVVFLATVASVAVPGNSNTWNTVTAPGAVPAGATGVILGGTTPVGWNDYGESGTDYYITGFWFRKASGAGSVGVTGPEHSVAGPGTSVPFTTAIVPLTASKTFQLYRVRGSDGVSGGTVFVLGYIS